jgi:hypothetical protein
MQSSTPGHPLWPSSIVARLVGLRRSLVRYYYELGLARVKINRLRLYTANGSSAPRLAESRMSRCGPEDSESSDGEGTRPWPGDREQYSPLPTNASALLVRVRPLTSRFRPASASLTPAVDGWPDLENNPGDKTVSSRTGPRLGDATFL